MKKYLIADGWQHIFAGSQPDETRWVLDVEARTLVCGFVRDGRCWGQLRGYSLLDLQEDVEHNVLREIDRGTFRKSDRGLKAKNKLPEWASCGEAAYRH